jgi:alpha-mannosidase
VRGAGYCVHPIKARQLILDNRYIKRMDQGESCFSFRIGLLERDRLERATQEFVQKPYAQNIFPTKAQIERRSFAVSLEDDSVALVTAKKADGRDAIIFRLLNNTADPVDTALCVQGQRIPLHFGKFEVKTVVFEDNTLRESDRLLI